MHSFIELPRMDSQGKTLLSIYVNTADIIAMQSETNSAFTRVDIRQFGSEGGSGVIRTYAPIASLLDILGMLADNPGVRSWSALTKAEWTGPCAGLSGDHPVTRRRLGVGAALALLLVAGYVALALWADERDQRFFMASEPRNWLG